MINVHQLGNGETLWTQMTEHFHFPLLTWSHCWGAELGQGKAPPSSPPSSQLPLQPESCRLRHHRPGPGWWMQLSPSPLKFQPGIFVVTITVLFSITCWPKNHSLPLKANCSFPNGLILLLKLRSFHKLSRSYCLGFSPSPLISAASLNCSSVFC